MPPSRRRVSGPRHPELRRTAETGTNLPLDWTHLAEEVDDATFPSDRPCTVEQILDADWWPERVAP